MSYNELNKSVMKEKDSLFLTLAAVVAALGGLLFGLIRLLFRGQHLFSSHIFS
ncbi:MAG: hypothetical protein HC830_01575 [Bacteroidetes bacterium]|nr:hypothetical protein [Bacteroidota bacterium]